MSCPFLNPREDGSHEYKYYCKSCKSYIGKTNDKQFVDDVCYSGEYSYEDCDAYKHPGHSPGVSPHELESGSSSSSSSSSSSYESRRTSYDSSSTYDSYQTSTTSSIYRSEKADDSENPYSLIWKFVGIILAILSPILIVCAIIDAVQYIGHSGVLDRHNNPVVEEISVQRINVGDILEFGTYEHDPDKAGLEDIEWIVLAKEDDRMLLLSRYALDCQPYNIYDEECTWETCSLRRWLNWTFYDSAFTEQEKAKIQTAYLSEDSNLIRRERFCNATSDRVFLLSYDEASRFFNSDSERECHPTNYAKAMGVTALRRFYYCCNWWLRTPGAYNNTASLIFNEGELYLGTDPVALVTNDTIGVRPAIWVVFDPSDNNPAIEPDLWYVGDNDQKDPYSDDWASTTVWPGSRPVDLAALASDRLELNTGGSSNVISWNSGTVRDVCWNEYQGYISFFIAEAQQPSPFITLDPGGDTMMLDAWCFVAGSGWYDYAGGSTDHEDSLGLRFYDDGKLIYDTGLIHSIDGAKELHIDLSGVRALKIELYAGKKDWGSESKIYLSGSVRDKNAKLSMPQPKPPERPDTVSLIELVKRKLAYNRSAPEGNYSDYTSSGSVRDLAGNSYTGYFIYGMRRHNSSAPWYLLDLGGEYKTLNLKYFIMNSYGETRGSAYSMGLRIYADDRLICDTGLVKGELGTQQLHLDVTGAKTLKLEAYAGDGTSEDCRLYLVDGTVSK